VEKLVIMKRILILILSAVFISGASAQDNSNVSPEKNVLKINTLSLLVGTGSVFYERRITDMTSAQLGVGYMNFSILGGDTRFSGLILNPEFRIYPRHNAIDGFYVSPYLRYQRYDLKNKNESAEGSLSSIGGGVAVGRQWIWPKGFIIDLFFGGHYCNATVKGGADTDTFDKTNLFEGFRMRMGFAIGFAF
jgi:hypothetical protein